LIVAEMLKFYRIEYDLFSLSVNLPFFEFFGAEGAPWIFVLRLLQAYLANDIFTSGTFVYISYWNLEANLALYVFEKISSFANIDFDLVDQHLLGFDHLTLDLFLNSFVVKVLWWLG